MAELTIAEIIQITSGEPVQITNFDLKPTLAVYDSREIVPDCIFAAFKGDHVDGHDYATAAVASGAALVLASRKVDCASVLVPDVQIALSQIATANRSKLNIPVLALTGSSGKTTTKDLLVDLLEGSGNIVATAGSKNNEIGLPTTLFGANLQTSAIVLEMGARRSGNIKELCEIAKPNIVGITNIGSAHLGIFGSVENLIATKSEILSGLSSFDTAVLNADQAISYQMAKQTKAKVYYAGLAATADFRITNLKLDELARASFNLLTPAGEIKVQLKLIGEHQATNAAIATAMAVAAGVSLKEIEAKLNLAGPRSPLRMSEIRLANVILLDDSYNANPESMKAALETLVRAQSPGRKMFVAGDMGELGQAAVELHKEFGAKVAAANIDLFWSTGELMQHAVTGALESGMPVERVNWLQTRDELAEQLRHEIKSGDLVLIKASRAAGFDQVVKSLKSDLEGQGR
jgi:UDP-N-acetylmuramoyl-tripeptide--D-alanyl-D-alanine ligase